jgi:hypothetical protein
VLLSDSVDFISPRNEASGATIPSVDQRATAQAVELARALCDQLHEMTRQLAWLEGQDVTGTTSRASAIRREVAALRQDINEAHFLIDRLERHYLNSNGHAQPRRPEEQP